MSKSKKPSKKPYSELLFENKFLRKQNKINNLVRLGEAFFKMLVVFIVFYFTYMTFDSLSGQVTSITADVSGKIKLDAELEFKNTLLTILSIVGTAFGLGGIFYGKKQRDLRKNAIENMSVDRRKYEELIDKNRTSSKLTPAGNTRKEDR